MTNNSIFRRIRFIFNFSDYDIMDVFRLVGAEVKRHQVIGWLNKEDHEDYLPMSDETLATFLNGFITLKRGKKEGPQPVPEKRLTNNIIFKKMRIALNLIDEDIIQILASVETPLSKHELSAFFRNPFSTTIRGVQQSDFKEFLSGVGGEGE